MTEPERMAAAVALATAAMAPDAKDNGAMNAAAVAAFMDLHADGSLPATKALLRVVAAAVELAAQTLGITRAEAWPAVAAEARRAVRP